jgi:hypothetical protein
LAFLTSATNKTSWLRGSGERDVLDGLCLSVGSGIKKLGNLFLATFQDAAKVNKSVNIQCQITNTIDEDSATEGMTARQLHGLYLKFNQISK